MLLQVDDHQTARPAALDPDEKWIQGRAVALRIPDPVRVCPRSCRDTPRDSPQPAPQLLPPESNGRHMIELRSSPGCAKMDPPECLGSYSGER